jgi:hypothetical protein
MRSFAMILVLFVSCVSQAKTVLVSDIDDTIKATNVRSIPGLIKNGLNLSNEFKGTSQLYGYIEDNMSASSKFYYVTGAPESVVDVHHAFLFVEWFPVGSVVNRLSLDQDTFEFKLGAITSVVEKEKPDLLILIGDNGEKDPDVYSKIKADRKIQLIHHVYDEEAVVGDFLTSIDLAFIFFANDWISEKQLGEFLKDMEKELDDEGWEEVLPEFMEYDRFVQKKRFAKIRDQIQSRSALKHYDKVCKRFEKRLKASMCR